MNTVGSFEAKTHFAKFLEQAAKGEELIITKHGQAMAKLVPASRAHHQEITQVFREIDQLRAKIAKGRSRSEI